MGYRLSVLETLPDKLRRQKDIRLKTEQALDIANEKIVKLSNHVEKLMLHLKHESAAKVQAVKAGKALEKKCSSSKSRVAALNKKVNFRDRVIRELKEGSKII